MKFLISSVFLLCMLSTSAAETTTPTNASLEVNQTEISLRPKPKKRNKRNKRINKKRKRACNKWARRSFAG